MKNEGKKNNHKGKFCFEWMDYQPDDKLLWNENAKVKDEDIEW